MNAIPEPAKTMARQIGEAAAASQRQRTGHAPESVSVVLSGDMLVVTLNGALSPAEQKLAQQSADGAAKVQQFHRHLFLTASDALRQEIERIIGIDVREAAAEVQPAPGAVVHAFTTGTMVQMFLLSQSVPTQSWEGDGSGGPIKKQEVV